MGLEIIDGEPKLTDIVGNLVSEGDYIVYRISYPILAFGFVDSIRERSIGLYQVRNPFDIPNFKNRRRFLRGSYYTNTILKVVVEENQKIGWN